jgi:fumarate reductase flavoprotein subunit
MAAQQGAPALNDVDVLVVGSGIAGLSAAVAAREAGAARVLVAESTDVVGGSSRLSGGLVMGAGTQFQRAAGIVDTADDLYHDYLALNQWRVDAGVVRRFCHACGPTVDWLADHGVPFTGELVWGGDERQPRTHVVDGRGQAIIDALHRTCRELDVDIALGRRVDALLVDGGRVVGAAAGDDRVRAGVVVLASGGFGANPAMLAERFPSAVQDGWTWYIGAEGAQGDGLELGLSVGAQLVGHDRGLRLLHPNFVRTYEAYQPAWIVVVDRDGRRFYDESAPYGIVDGVHRAAGDRAFVLFDDAMLHHRDRWPTFKDPWMDARFRGSPNWNPDMVAEQVAKGAMHRTATVAELALALGLPPGVLAGTVDVYNADVDSGYDRQFAKAPAFLRPLRTPPFYGAEVRPATLCFTACGVRIDPDGRVLHRTGHAVPGLFAAGETTGGVIGERYMGSGNSLGNGATMGRVAGTVAAGGSWPDEPVAVHR